MNDIDSNENNGLTSNRSMYDNRGKYFDTYQFNKNFDEYIEKQNKKRLKNEELQNHDLNKIDSIKLRPYNLSFSRILKNIQSMWFRYYDNIINGKNIFFGSSYNDLFYLSMTFITIFLIYIILYLIFT